jgi:septal ring factor EnvC (AmiA/AmiB activator)
MTTVDLHTKLVKINESQKKIMAQAKARQEELVAQLSKYDLMTTDIEHYLELEKCDAVDMVLVAQKLKEIRRNRRQTKIELDQVNCLIQFEGRKDIAKYDATTYKYRTQVISDIKKRRN